MTKVIIHSTFENQGASLKKLIENFDTVGNEFGNQNRNTIKVVPFDQLNLNIKSFKPPHLINKISYGYFRKSKAERSYEYANKLISTNIGTPQPIAYFEYTDSFGLNNSYYISEHLEADFTFKNLVEQPNLPDHEQILRGFVRFTHHLHQSQILFKDHSPGNTLILKETDGSYSYYLVDLNRMDFKELSFEERMINFSRLTPKKEMIAIMSNEYAKITEQPFDMVFEAMWGETKKFQEKFFRKKRLKRILKFYKKTS